MVKIDNQKIINELLENLKDSPNFTDKDFRKENFGNEIVRKLKFNENSFWKKIRDDILNHLKKLRFLYQMG